MSPSSMPNSEQPKKAKVLSLWLAYPLALFVWDVLPWAIALLTPHSGWTAGRPGIWNLLGLAPVLVGNLGLLWGIRLHAGQSSGGLEWELDKSYLLKDRLYAFSRNPMYLTELILLFGWIVFYGSLALLIAFVAWGLFFNYYLIPNEERVLEAHFGEAYRAYKARVPRWLGKPRL